MRKQTIGNATLYLGDSAEVPRHIEAGSVDACVTDPPYGLSFMNAKWDHDVPRAALWRLVNDALKPGAHLLSFFGSRTYHRGAVEIEDAGFDIRDQIMWLFGTGFPKSHDISKAIDRAAGAKREVVGSKLGQPGYHLSGHEGGEAFGAGLSSSTPETRLALSQITAPATVEAQHWQGWGTALKPAHEPIVVARKPFASTVAGNVILHGTGAMNIDACRIGSGSGVPARAYVPNMLNAVYGAGMGGGVWNDSKGRFPANIIHDGSDEVEAGFPGEAARFFYCAKASRSDRDGGCEELAPRNNMRVNAPRSSEEAKHSTRRGNNHPTVKPTDLMRYLCRLVTPPAGVVLDPFMGSGSTGKAALMEGFQFIGIERDPEYYRIACARIAAAQGLADQKLG